MATMDLGWINRTFKLSSASAELADSPTRTVVMRCAYYCIGVAQFTSLRVRDGGKGTNSA